MLKSVGGADRNKREESFFTRKFHYALGDDLKYLSRKNYSEEAVDVVNGILLSVISIVSKKLTTQDKVLKQMKSKKGTINSDLRLQISKDKIKAAFLVSLPFAPKRDQDLEKAAEAKIKLISETEKKYEKYAVRERALEYAKELYNFRKQPGYDKSEEKLLMDGTLDYQDGVMEDKKNNLKISWELIKQIYVRYFEAEQKKKRLTKKQVYESKFSPHRIEALLRADLPHVSITNMAVVYMMTVMEMMLDKLPEFEENNQKIETKDVYEAVSSSNYPFSPLTRSILTRITDFNIESRSSREKSDEQEEMLLHGKRSGTVSAEKTPRGTISIKLDPSMTKKELSKLSHRLDELLNEKVGLNFFDGVSIESENYDTVFGKGLSLLPGKDILLLLEAKIALKERYSVNLVESFVWKLGYLVDYEDWEDERVRIDENYSLLKRLENESPFELKKYDIKPEDMENMIKRRWDGYVADNPREKINLYYGTLYNMRENVLTFLKNIICCPKQAEMDIPGLINLRKSLGNYTNAPYENKLIIAFLKAKKIPTEKSKWIKEVLRNGVFLDPTPEELTKCVIEVLYHYNIDVRKAETVADKIERSWGGVEISDTRGIGKLQHKNTSETDIEHLKREKETLEGWGDALLSQSLKITGHREIIVKIDNLRKRLIEMNGQLDN